MAGKAVALNGPYYMVHKTSANAVAFDTRRTGTVSGNLWNAMYHSSGRRSMFGGCTPCAHPPLLNPFPTESMSQALL